MLTRFLATSAILFSLATLGACTTITITDQSRGLLAEQAAEAALAKGLALRVRGDAAIIAGDKANAGKLYNEAVVSNNAVISDLVLQLQQPGVTQIHANPTAASQAIQKLRAFRIHAQDIAALGDVSPKEMGGQASTRGGPELLLVTQAASAAYDWWSAGDKRSRQALIDALEKYRLASWQDVSNVD